MEQQFCLENLTETKQAACELLSLDDGQRNHLLRMLAERLRRAVRDIVAANEKDLSRMSASNPMYDRLLLTPQRIESIAGEVENVASLPSPLMRTLEQKTMPNGLEICRISVPLGTVAVIYESRPNVTVDVFSLCFKSGNACVLKGGKEAVESNTVLVRIIKETLAANGVNPQAIHLFPSSREDTVHLLNAVGLIDVCIPRGSKALIDYVRSNAKIPVIETGAGVVHTYFDADGDLEKGQRIVKNAKTRRVSVCNALDCLIVHAARLDDLHRLVAPLAEAQVAIFADAPAFDALNGKYPLLHQASENDYGTEFLDYRMSIKTVADLDEARKHIARYGTQHSEAIVTENAAVAAEFIRTIDAAAVYHNAPTSFTDGAQFGLGAEIGISTQKLHARGPMSLDALTSYKWVIKGNGQIRD
jgi:glutamate-5-semialdehyde dehydrogenase